MNDTATVQPAAPTPEPSLEPTDPSLAELHSVLGDIRGSWASLSALPAEFKALKQGAERFSGELREVRRNLLARGSARAVRPVGQVSEECARHLAAQFIVQCQPSDRLEALSSVSAQ